MKIYEESYFQIGNGMEEMQRGVEILLLNYKLPLEGKGIVMEAVKTDKERLEVRYQNRKAVITYQKKAHFFRGFMHLLSFIQRYECKQHYCMQNNCKQNNCKQEYYKEEYVYFDTNGAMFDCSRNAVLKTNTLKYYIRNMAMLGMNRMLLYMEDTYTIEQEPHFGAFRGRYTKEELISCEQYAQIFGIEMIPCIQTLAHLHTLLRYPDYEKMKDTQDILFVGKERVYELIEAMIKTLSECFQSKNIHLGMDEAHDLGLGNYLSEHGVRDRYQIMKEHLTRVFAICKKYDRNPMMWSDMFFRLGSPTKDYYDVPRDAQFPKEALPEEEVGLVYWDYYHEEKEHYKNYIALHRKLGERILFAGGAWTFNGIAPNYSKMMVTSESALYACKEEKLRDVFVTIWQDNGAETPAVTAIPTLALYAEHGFSQKPEKADINQRIEFIFGLPSDGLRLLDSFDNMEGTEFTEQGADNPSKYILYQDILLGLFDKQIEGLGIGKHYRKLAAELAIFVQREDETLPLFSYYSVLSQLLSLKAELGIQIYEAYHKQNHKELLHIAEDILPDSILLANKLSDCREKIWLAECKPQGFEVLDIRFAGLSRRLNRARKRIFSYLSGDEEQLLELEEQRIFYKEVNASEKHKLISLNNWEYIVSAGNITGV